MLRARGADAQLRIGVRKDGGMLEAHAWVECEGFLLQGQDDTGECFVQLKAGESSA
jgi:hypothetical protein